MKTRVYDLLTQALRLPADERSALVIARVDSFEGSTDASISEAWREEIARRRQMLKSGSATPVPWAEARARIDSL